jgi:hypothetical protein
MENLLSRAFTAILRLAVFPEIIGTLHLLREIIEDLRQRAAVSGCHGPSNLSTVPYDRAAGEYERKERHDQAYIPRHVVTHAQTFPLLSLWRKSPNGPT